jgi:hypothetical protein
VLSERTELLKPRTWGDTINTPFRFPQFHIPVPLFFYPEDGGSRFVRNIAIYLTDDVTSQKTVIFISFFSFLVVTPNANTTNNCRWQGSQLQGLEPVIWGEPLTASRIQRGPQPVSLLSFSLELSSHCSPTEFCTYFLFPHPSWSQDAKHSSSKVAPPAWMSPEFFQRAYKLIFKPLQNVFTDRPSAFSIEE